QAHRAADQAPRLFLHEDGHCTVTLNPVCPLPPCGRSPVRVHRTETTLAGRRGSAVTKHEQAVLNQSMVAGSDDVADPGAYTVPAGTVSRITTPFAQSPIP